MGIPIYSSERSDTAAEGAALGLLGLMTGISEEYWCAGWLKGLEFDLWDAQPNSTHGHGVITERQAVLLRLLSEECEGWWHLEDGADNPQFISIAEWLKILAKRTE
jgi:hypothetical protein